jgi:hypothetical protein
MIVSYATVLQVIKCVIAGHFPLGSGESLRLAASMGGFKEVAMPCVNRSVRYQKAGISEVPLNVSLENAIE